MKIAVRFEEKVYAAATSQSDYLWRISLKMLSLETKSQPTMANSLPSISVQGDWRTQLQPESHQQQTKKILFVQLNFMGNNNLGPIQGGEPTMDTSDWRTRLQPGPRQRIVNKILDTLKKHLPFSGQEGLLELMKIAVRFEEKVYAAATSQSDYLRRISLKMLSLETKSQPTMANSLPSISVQGDWRTQLQPKSRQQQTKKILYMLKKRLPFSGTEGLRELKKMAEGFEEKMYNAATSKYVRAQIAFCSCCELNLFEEKLNLIVNKGLETLWFQSLFNS
ncbi:hypothetical protein FNV43_RR22211 [Rhamnella rubrinervis]|uniref:Mediator complex subunit 15 KIX domain-containing protein n=1 Tax=Rhamnella rubrinervis TaxID=2594499 RepID=A0A8K0DW46_9ROSA|nr:hypothetical protein FNV43_RR22211 [Rhamnella rubrinervis]